MGVNDCYIYLDNLIATQDFSGIGKNFTAMLYLTGEESGYVYLSYTDGKKCLEAKKHDSANIFLSMSTDVFEQIVLGQTDVLRAFTTGKILAKGNVILALQIYNSFKQALVKLVVFPFWHNYDKDIYMSNDNKIQVF